MKRFSRMAQDSILYKMSVTQDEIIRLKKKQTDEGLSEWEFQTLTMLQNDLRRLRRM